MRHDAYVDEAIPTDTKPSLVAMKSQGQSAEELIQQLLILEEASAEDARPFCRLLCDGFKLVIGT